MSSQLDSYDDGVGSGGDSEDMDDREMGKFRGKWVSFDRLLYQVYHAERNFIVKWEAIRFVAFTCVFVPYVLLHYNIPAVFDVQSAIKYSLIEKTFVDAGTQGDLLSFHDIHSLDSFLKWLDHFNCPVCSQSVAISGRGY